MTVTIWEILVYVVYLGLLWVTPGPVWAALTARALAGGFPSAWPLAVGVALGDLFWPLCAILGLSWIEGSYGEVLSALRWVAAGILIAMGWLLIRRPALAVTADSRLTRPGLWAGFTVGVAAVIGNPKAILFYMGVLPGFFDLARLTWGDVGVIIFLSALVPMLGNLSLALFLDRVRKLLQSPAMLHRLNLFAGWLLIAVGVAIPLL